MTDRSFLAGISQRATSRPAPRISRRSAPLLWIAASLTAWLAIAGIVVALV